MHRNGQRLPGHIFFVGACSLPQYHTDLLEFAVFQDTPDQFQPWILFLIHRGGGFRQHHAGFNLKQCCRHDQKGAGYIDIEFPKLLQISHILLCKLGYRNIVYVYLVFINQVHQKVHWTFKCFQMDRIPLIVFLPPHQKKGESTATKISQIMRCAGTKIRCRIGVQIRTMRIRKL